MSNKLCLIVALSLTLLNIVMSKLNPEEKLIQNLLNQSSLKVRPSGCSSRCNEPVFVNITYNVIQILAFSQAEETLSISGWFTIMWQDPRLQWNYEDYGNVSEVFLSSENIWIPDVGVMNGKSSSDFDFSSNVKSRLTVNYTGRITWMHGVVMDVTCPLDVSYFPFDQQVCYLIVTPWQSPISHIRIWPFTHGPAVDNSYLPNSNVSEWVIKDVRFTLKEYKSQLNYTYKYISIGIEIQRQPLYFIVLVLVPFSMLSFLACLIFTLDDTGDRLSVALSLVLSMTMYVVIVSSNAPRSMRTLPVLGIYLLDQLGLLSVATVLAVVNNKLRSYRVDQSAHRHIYAPYRLPLANNCLHHHDQGNLALEDSPILALQRCSAPAFTPQQQALVQHYQPHRRVSNSGITSPANSISYHHQQLQHLRHPHSPPPLPPALSAYASLATTLDHVELTLYLILSAVNAFVWLILMPNAALHPTVS